MQVFQQFSMCYEAKRDKNIFPTTELHLTLYLYNKAVNLIRVCQTVLLLSREDATKKRSAVKHLHGQTSLDRLRFKLFSLWIIMSVSSGSCLQVLSVQGRTLFYFWWCFCSRVVIVVSTARAVVTGAVENVAWIRSEDLTRHRRSLWSVSFIKYHTHQQTAVTSSRNGRLSSSNQVCL